MSALHGIQSVWNSVSYYMYMYSSHMGAMCNRGLVEALFFLFWSPVPMSYEGVSAIIAGTPRIHPPVLAYCGVYV